MDGNLLPGQESVLLLLLTESVMNTAGQGQEAVVLRKQDELIPEFNLHAVFHFYLIKLLVNIRVRGNIMELKKGQNQGKPRKMVLPAYWEKLSTDLRGWGSSVPGTAALLLGSSFRP